MDLGLTLPAAPAAVIHAGWRVVAAAAAGTAHRARGRDCEDRCAARVLRATDGMPVLAMVVADGAGSALWGARGATLAVEATFDTLEDWLAGGHASDDELPWRALAVLRARVAALAALEGGTARDYATTWLGLVAHRSGTLAWQIGDGALVLDCGDGLELAHAPMSGKYANMTRFATDDDATQHLALRRWPQPVQRAAAFSDGLQRLALDLAAARPHAPLFEHLFGVMQAADDSDALWCGLQRFLDSETVNARTGDDKSLVLALRRP